MNLTDLREAYAAIRSEASQLAGNLADLAQRATTYHHLYQDSGGNHIFPLIAAHGALWARGYFRFGMRLGHCLSMCYGFDGQWRRKQLGALTAFADAFRDINRRVCVDTYTNYHFVARFGNYTGAEEFMPSQLFEALQRLHCARRRNYSLAESERLAVFEAHFMNEQEHEVGPSIARASLDFQWPAMKWLALQPIVRFAYFPGWQFLRFRNFADVQERIRNGLQAFRWGSQVGWPVVEDKLRTYRILPAEFFTEGTGFFTRLRTALLTASPS
jgi:hypothetical protein